MSKRSGTRKYQSNLQNLHHMKFQENKDESSMILLQDAIRIHSGATKICGGGAFKLAGVKFNIVILDEITPIKGVK